MAADDKLSPTATMTMLLQGVSISNSSSHSNPSLASGHMVGDYVLQDKLGEGAFAQVYKAYHRFSHQLVAVKCVDRQKFPVQSAREASILPELKHPNIVRVHEVIKTHTRVYLVEEFCSGGDLSCFIRERGMLPEALVRSIGCQIVEALKYLRQHDVMHRDLKPANVLLSPGASEGHWVVKLADFGFAKQLQPGQVGISHCGSDGYKAPEIGRDESYGPEVDLWSFGALVHRMLFKARPNLKDGRVVLPLSLPLQHIGSSEFRVSAHLESLLLGLLEPHPKTRLDFARFFDHPFWKESDASPSSAEQPSRDSNSDTATSATPAKTVVTLASATTATDATATTTTSTSEATQAAP